MQSARLAGLRLRHSRSQAGQRASARYRRRRLRARVGSGTSSSWGAWHTCAKGVGDATGEG